MNPRTTNADKFVGHEDRYQDDRIHEEKEEESESEEKEEKKNALQEALKKIANAKRVFLGNKRIK